MITAFALLLDRCGLSHREAAEFLEVRLDTVKSLASGRLAAKPGHVAELRGLYARIELAATESLAIIAEQAPDQIELALANDDYEAQQLGWSCVGAQAAMLGIVAARCGISVRIVPRGTTIATAAAADMHTP